jgi:hypothetical protein
VADRDKTDLKRCFRKYYGILNKCLETAGKKLAFSRCAHIRIGEASKRFRPAYRKRLQRAAQVELTRTISVPVNIASANNGHQQLFNVPAKAGWVCILCAMAVHGFRTALGHLGHGLMSVLPSHPSQRP